MDPNFPAEKVMSMQDWLITLIIMLIPIVNVIMLFVWGFGSGTHPSKANWAKASLLVILIGLVFWSIVGFLFGFAVMSSLGDIKLND
jgi:hypothetical protein